MLLFIFDKLKVSVMLCYSFFLKAPEKLLGGDFSLAYSINNFTSKLITFMKSVSSVPTGCVMNYGDTEFNLDHTHLIWLHKVCLTMFIYVRELVV